MDQERYDKLNDAITDLKIRDEKTAGEISALKCSVENAVETMHKMLDHQKSQFSELTNIIKQQNQSRTQEKLSGDKVSIKKSDVIIKWATVFGIGFLLIKEALTAFTNGGV